MPKLDEFTITIIILAIPGIVTYFLLSKLIGKIGRDLFDRLLLILIFSMVAYSIYFLIFNPLLTQHQSEQVSFLSTFTNQFRFIDILYTTIISFILVFVLAYIYNYNLFNLLAQKIRSTKRYGDEDVWHYFHASFNKRKNKWLYVRDKKNDLVYFGYISAYSETNEDRELLMHEVSVYINSTAQFIYDTDFIYLCLHKNDFTIELAKNNLAEKENGKSNKS